MAKNNNKKKKIIFGRNIFTIVVVLVVLLIGTIIADNIITSVQNDVTPFVTKADGTTYDEGTYDLENCKKIKLSELEEFGLKFVCTEYNEDTQQIKYTMTTYLTEKSKDIISGSCTAQVCVASDYIGFISYSTKHTTVKFAADLETAENSSTYQKTFTISSVIDYPAKSQHWPFPITVDSPTTYLYISYNYNSNGAKRTETFLIEFSYKDLLPETGGIAK